MCREGWGAQAVNSAYFVGFLVGAGLWGMLSDRIGAQAGPTRASLPLANHSMSVVEITIEAVAARFRARCHRHSRSAHQINVTGTTLYSVPARAAAGAVRDSGHIVGLWLRVRDFARLLVVRRDAGFHRCGPPHPPLRCWLALRLAP